MVKDDMKRNNVNLGDRFWEFIVAIYDKSGVKEAEMETRKWQMRAGSDLGPVKAFCSNLLPNCKWSENY